MSAACLIKLAAEGRFTHIAAMQHNSPALVAPSPDVARMGVLEAIARRVLLTAAYNGQRLTLAPHALFARRGELYASALNLSKTWRADEERRLGYFKVAGLAAVEVTEDPFDALPNAAGMLAGAGDEVLLAVT
jgi:hypothetical protein